MSPYSPLCKCTMCFYLVVLLLKLWTGSSFKTVDCGKDHWKTPLVVALHNIWCVVSWHCPLCPFLVKGKQHLFIYWHLLVWVWLWWNNLANSQPDSFSRHLNKPRIWRLCVREFLGQSNLISISQRGQSVLKQPCSNTPPSSSTTTTTSTSLKPCIHFPFFNLTMTLSHVPRHDISMQFNCRVCNGGGGWVGGDKRGSTVVKKQLI